MKDGHCTVDTGHGRIAERFLWATTPVRNYVEFPYLRQDRIARRTRKLDGTPLRPRVKGFRRPWTNVTCR